MMVAATILNLGIPTAVAVADDLDEDEEDENEARDNEEREDEEDEELQGYEDQGQDATGQPTADEDEQDEGLVGANQDTASEAENAHDNVATS